MSHRYLELIKVLRKRANEMIEQNDSSDSEVRDNATLLLVLANMIDGKSIYEAFGAPGDWGYDTPIGDALRTCYHKTESQSSVSIGAPSVAK